MIHELWPEELRPRPRTLAVSRPQAPLAALVFFVALVLRMPWQYGIEHVRYWWDESFLFENAVSLAFAHDPKPVSVYYLAAHLPHTVGLIAWDAFSRAWEGLRGEPFYPLRGGREQGNVFLILRSSQAVVGALSALVVLGIGRRLGRPALGVVAALLVAFSPLHINHSQQIKPAAAMGLAAVLALAAALRLLARPSAASAALAGFAVGSTVAMSYNGVSAALPFVAALALARPGWKRSVGLALLGAGSSLLAFVAFNPWFLVDPGWYLHTIRYLEQVYAGKELVRGYSLPGLLWLVLSELPFEVLGWPLGFVVFPSLGVVALDLASSLRRLELGLELRQSLVIGVAALGHIAFTMSMTRMWLQQHYSPAIGAIGLLAALFPERLWSRARARAPGPGPGWLAERLALLALLGALLPVGVARLYREQGVQTTAGLALRTIGALAPSGSDPAEGAPRARGLTLTLGVDVSLDVSALALDETHASSARLLERADWLVVEAEAARRCLAEAAAPGAPPATGGCPVLLDASLELERTFTAHWPARIGPRVLLYRVRQQGAIRVEMRALSLAEFATEGVGFADAEILWLRGPGSRASAEARLAGLDCEQVIVEATAGSDDSALEGARLGMELGLSGSPATHFEVARSELRDYRSEPRELEAPEARVQVAYAGDPGGRIYLTRVVVEGWLPSARLRPEWVRWLRGQEVEDPGFALESRPLSDEERRACGRWPSTRARLSARGALERAGEPTWQPLKARQVRPQPAVAAK